MLALTCLKTCYGNVSNGIGVPFLVFFSFTNKVILKLTQKGYPGPFYQSLKEKWGQQVLSLSSGLVERYGKDQRKPCLLSQGNRKLASSTVEVSKQLRGRKWEVGLQRIREKTQCQGEHVHVFGQYQEKIEKQEKLCFQSRTQKCRQLYLHCRECVSTCVGGVLSHCPFTMIIVLVSSQQVFTGLSLLEGWSLAGGLKVR